MHFYIVGLGLTKDLSFLKHLHDSRDEACCESAQRGAQSQDVH